MKQFAVADRVHRTYDGVCVPVGTPGTVIGYDGNDYYSVLFDNGLTLTIRDFIEPHVDVFPIPAANDPWRESEPAAVCNLADRGRFCLEQDSSRLNCNRPKGHDGYHVARRLPEGKVLARWPQAAPAEKRGPQVGDKVVCAREEQLIAFSLLVGARGYVTLVRELTFDCDFNGLYYCFSLNQFADVIIPAAEWDARQKTTPLQSGAPIAISKITPSALPPPGKSGQYIVGGVWVDGDITGAYPPPKCQATTPESIKATAAALTRHVESVMVHPSALARSLFELDFAEHADRVGDEGKGGIGKAAVLERMWSRASEETLAEYGWRAAVVLRRAGELP